MPKLRRGAWLVLIATVLMGPGSGAGAQEWKPLLPGDLRWMDVPSYPGVQFALLSGGLGKPGPFTVRAKFPPNYRLGPHTHTDDRGLTILEGSWMQGIGDQLDPAKAVQMPAGSFVLIPANQVHFDISGPEGATVQVTGIGESLTRYLDPADDPKSKYK